ALSAVMRSTGRRVVTRPIVYLPDAYSGSSRRSHGTPAGPGYPGGTGCAHRGTRRLVLHTACPDATASLSGELRWRYTKFTRASQGHYRVGPLSGDGDECGSPTDVGVVNP